LFCRLEWLTVCVMRINIRQSESEMQTLISPQIDCVFKAILASEENKTLLIHFLNAVLAPTLEQKIVSVTLLPPFNEREFSCDKITTIDVMAQDQNVHHYQIKIQMQISHELPSRMAYTWSELYRSQLIEGDSFTQLKPTILIWLLGDNLTATKQSLTFHHCFELHDQLNKVSLTDHCQIHTLELKKSNKDEIKNDIDYWSWLFSQNQGIDVEHLPSVITENPYMRQAMEIIKRFTQNEKERHIYQRQLDYQRVQADKRIAQARLEAKYNSLEVECNSLEAETDNLMAEIDTLKVETSSIQADLDKTLKRQRHLLLKLQQVETDS
jgi:predicted transposase/invertase (TIGR01784 family)